MPLLWLRAETKLAEHRSPLTPTTAARLRGAGFDVTVERSSQRIFDDVEFERADCKLVNSGSWMNAPVDAFILGLKELPENTNFPIKHRHIYFAHCYKNQAGWSDILARFVNGGGILFDLEFLMDENSKRVAAFGYHAGFAGAAIGIDVWCHQQLEGVHSTYPPIHPCPNETQLISRLKSRLSAAQKIDKKFPQVMVIGSLGRCGTGAMDLIKKVDIPQTHIVGWDLAETSKGGPFTEILDANIFINCIYLSQPIPPFITTNMLNEMDRCLSVVVDVSCDLTNSYNPLPIYSSITTLDQPLINFQSTNPTSVPLSIIAIDHLPTLLPRESSEAFSSSLLPSLIKLPQWETESVWVNAFKLFNQKVQLL